MKFVTYLLLSIALLSVGTLAAAQTDHNHDHDHADQTPPQTPVLPTEGVYSELSTDHVIGAPMAPVTMIIYASLTCPHCASWFNSVWLDIKKNYVDKSEVRVVLREFPTAPREIAVIGFQIANCAPEDQYFAMLEHQFAEQDNIFAALKANKAKEKYLEIAKKAGLADETAMNACLREAGGIERINTSMLLSQAAGIKSVPSFIIDGQVYKGGMDYLALSKYLDNLSKRGYSAIPKR
ncbi:MAG: hypothetical protein COA91_10300 [Robiginitomaculum sp.]|nr:MAG: hypothetical protein COA91_10300 [Robiginitomaculum sp.]